MVFITLEPIGVQYYYTIQIKNTIDIGMYLKYISIQIFSRIFANSKVLCRHG